MARECYIKSILQLKTKLLWTIKQRKDRIKAEVCLFIYIVVQSILSLLKILLQSSFHQLSKDLSHDL